uniref:BTB domain-containing protein n=1 Tax=Steinernema glaseri TaxID=37863 RepID=A0A1I7YCP1_9BILA
MANGGPGRVYQFSTMGNAGAGRFPISHSASGANRILASLGRHQATDDLQSSPQSSNSSFSSRGSQKFEVVSKQATKVTAISTKLEWKIDQFEKLMKLFKNGHNLISKQFLCPQAPTVIWELHVYPNGKREEDVGNVSFFLRQVGLQRGEEPIMTEFQIYTTDKDGNRVSVCRDTKDFTNQQGRGKFQVQREKMTGALKHDGSLVLICEVEYFPPGAKLTVEQADESEFDSEEFEERHEYCLRSAMKDMFESERLADCTINVDGKEFKAHRCILAQHSEVFRSMFTNDSMIEAQKGEIDITDSKPEAVRAMLEFIYTGSTTLTLADGYNGSYQSDKQYAQDVLAIADKYAILSLKEQCERFLANSVDAKTVASTIMFADTYSANILRVACTRFIMSNQRDVIRSAEWRQLKRERGDLINGVLEAILVGDPDGDFSNYESFDESTAECTSSETSFRDDRERSPIRKRRRFPTRT